MRYQIGAAYTIFETKSCEAVTEMFLGYPHLTIFPGDGDEHMECLIVPEMPK